MTYGEFRRGALISASALALAALLGTASVPLADAQTPGQGAPSYTPGQTGGATDSTGMTRNRAPTTSPRQRGLSGNSATPADPSIATGHRPTDGSTNMNSPARTPTAPMDTDTGNDPGGRNQPATR